MEESRLDRIEKGMEAFFQGMNKFREESEKAAKKFREESEEAAKKFREESEAAAKKLREESEKAAKEISEIRLIQKEIALSQKKTDEQMQRTDERLEKTIKRLDEVGRQLGDLGLVQGEVAEDLFYRNMEYLFDRRKLKFGNIHRNLKKKGIAEYDIVAVNDDKILVIEVKNKLETRMIDRFVNDKLPKFRLAFPEYSDYRLIGGMGALVVKDAVGRYAEKAGLYVMTQSGDGGAMLINPKSFRAKEFL